MSIFDHTTQIKILFDKPIISTLSEVTGSEEVVFRMANYIGLSSGDYAGNPVSSMLDGNTGSLWRAAATSPPAYVGVDFGIIRKMSRAEFYLSSYKPGNYKWQGCNDGVSWVDVATGTFTATSGWQSISFAETAYRYWRLYVTTFQTAGRLYIYEAKFYITRNTYSIPSGWLISSTEYLHIPPLDNAVPSYQTYDIYKIDKADNDYSVVIYLKTEDRLKYPIGDVLVTFTGTLLGAGNSFVQSFSLPITLGNSAKIFNPCNLERLSGTISRVSVVILDIVYKYIPSESNTFLIADPDNPYMDEHVSGQITNLTIVITNIGGLPL